MVTVNGTAFRAGLRALSLAILIGSAAAWAEDPAPRPHIVVGSEFDYPPYASVTKDGQADGFSVDLMRAVCDAEGIDVTFRVGPWSELRAALEKGEIDALSLMSYSKERAEHFDFSILHTVAHGAVFMRKGTPGIGSVVDLRDKSIIAMRADAGHDWLLRNDISGRLILTETIGEAFKLLVEGKGDYLLAPRLVGLMTLRDLRLSGIEITGPLIDAYGRGYGFAVKKGNAALLLQLNDGMRIVKETGSYEALYEKWFGVVEPAGIRRDILLRYVQWAVLTAFLLAVLAVAWIILLRHTVKARTRELQAARDGLERLVADRTRELRDRNFVLDAVIEGSADVIFVKDRDGRILHANRAMARNFQVDVSDLIGKSAADLHSPQIAAAVKARDDAVIAAGAAIDSEEVIGFGEELRTFHTFKMPYRDETGHVVGLIGIARDITERKRFEEIIRALAESGGAAGGDVLRFLVRQLAVSLDKRCVFVARVEGDDLTVSQTLAVWDDGGFADNFTYGLAGTPCGEVVERDTCSYPHGVQKLFPNQKLLAALGAESYWGTPLRDSAGKVIGIMAVIDDKPMEATPDVLSLLNSFAARAAAEIERRRLEERYSVLFREMQDGMAVHEIILDDAGWPVDYRFLAANPAFERMTGLAADAVVGRTVLEVMPDTEPYWIETYGRVAMTGEPIHFQNFSRALGKHFEVVAFRPQKGQFATLFRDVTEQKRVAEAFREREEVYRSVVATTPDPFWINDTSGRLVEVNDSYVRRSGYSRDELLAMKVTDLEAAETTSDVIDHIERMKTVGSEVFVSQHRTKSGEIWDVEVAISYSDVLGGRIFAFFRDITDRLRAERGLRQSEARMRLLLSGVAVGIGVEDLEGKTVSPNEGLARMLGYTPDEVRAMLFTQYTHPDYAERDRALFREMALGKRDGYQMEKRYLAKDGRVVWGRLTRTLVRDDNGRPQYCLGMVENITERKQAEEALRESEERFAKAFRASPAPMSISMIDSGLTLDVNDEWLRMLGFTRDEVIGKTSAELGAWEGATPRDAFIGRLKMEGSFRNFEATVMTKTGQPRRVVLAAETIDRDRMLLVFHDITDRLDMEHRLAQAQKMEAVGQLTGGIAHDFNNLLQVVMINLELARDRLAGDEQTRRYVLAAIGAGQRGATLTQHLLSFSRQQILRPSQVDANHLLEGMHDLLARTLGEDVEIAMHLEEGLPPIIVDAHGLESAILNLALNARAAMPKGGHLTIRTGRRHLDRELSVEGEALKIGDYVELAVTDTGCGMAAEVLAHAFEPFFTTKEVGEGSGLGLSMVYGFTRQSGGQATLESEVGKGTTAVLLLPVAEAVVERGDRPVRPAGGGVAGSRVLVVEDDADVRSATAMVLKACGCDVQEAEDGMSALAMLDADRTIDLLFSDVVMPKGMSGAELADEAVRRHAGLKVILTSGYPDVALAKSGLADKGFRLLRKPFSKADLIQTLAAVLGTRGGKADGGSQA